MLKSQIKIVQLWRHDVRIPDLEKKQTSSHRRVENDCSRDQRPETLHAGPQTGPGTTGQDNLGQKNRTQGSSSWSRYVFHRNRHVQSTENHRDVLRLDRRPRAGRGNRRLSGLFSFNSRSWRRKKKLQQSLWSLLFFFTYRELQPGLAVTKHQSCWVSKLWRHETLVLRPDHLWRPPGRFTLTFTPEVGVAWTQTRRVLLNRI